MKTDIFCERAVWKGDEIDFYVRTRGESQLPCVWQPVQVKQLLPLDEGLRTEPAFSLSTDAAQMLMDELWRVGLRPTEGTGSAGAMAAVQKHLEDMRKLAFANFAASPVRGQVAQTETE